MNASDGFVTATFSRVKENSELLVALDVFVDLGRGHEGRDILRAKDGRGSSADCVLMLLSPKGVDPVSHWGSFELGRLVEEEFRDHEKRLRELRSEMEIWDVE